MTWWPALTDISPPEPGRELYWLLALLASACGVLFWQLVQAKDARTGDWKTVADKATGNLETALASLRTINDAVERTSRDHSAQLDRNAQAIVQTQNEVRKLVDLVATHDRRMERFTDTQTDRGRASPP